jgi:hypothetical protein
MNNPETFRPRSNYASGGGIIVLGVGMTGASFYEGSLGSVINTFAWSAFFSLAAYLIFIRPKVVFYDEGVVITNPFHEHQIGWGDVESVEAKYTMFLIVGEEKIHAWAAPGPGRYHSRTIHPNELRGLAISGQENFRPGESPRTHSGVATHLARLRLDAFRKGSLASAKRIDSFDRASVYTVAAFFAVALFTLIF